ncbi:MAG: hypothetical protein ACM3UY_06905 [Methanocella sp.]
MSQTIFDLAGTSITIDVRTLEQPVTLSSATINGAPASIVGVM